MPHVAFVSMSGFRVRDEEMRALGVGLPGLKGRAEAIAGLPALGLLTLAGMTPSEWSTSYREARTVDEGMVDEISAEAPTLVAISALTASIEEAYRLSDALRIRGHRVVLGGLHVTACPVEAARHADAVVIGDGEPVWLGVLGDARRGELAREYRSEQPFDLAHAPTPRFELLGPRSRPRFTLQTARGCPFACDFCGASRLLGPFREKPVEHIARELAAIQRLDENPWLELADDNTFAGRRSAAELFDVLEASGARYFTEADWRVGERDDVLEGLARSGCVQVLVGIESLVHRHGGMGAKNAKLERIMLAVEAIQDAGVAVIGCCIVGSDGEDRGSLERLTEFLLDSPFADVQVTLQTPFPGTPLYHRLFEAGRLLADRSWSAYSLFDVTYRPDRLSVGELEQGFRDVCRTVFAAEPARVRSERRRSVWASNARLRP